MLKLRNTILQLGIPIFFLVIISLFAIKALFHSGFYTSHDGWHQVARLYHFTQAISDGQYPPRWGGLLLNGFGYPLYIFSYHLPWWLASPLYFSGMNIFDSIKTIFILTYVVSGIFMFLYINDMWGKLAGFMAAFFYLFTPYRFATILVRANIGEAVSFMTIPLIFWGIYRLFRKKIISGLLLLSTGIAGSLLTHVMVSNLFVVPVVLYSLVLLSNLKKNQRIAFIGWVLCALVFGIGLSIYYLLPAIYYQPLTIFDQFKGIYRNLYKDHFTSFSNLFYSPWGYGAIGSGSEMSRQVGLVIWAAVILILGKFIQRFVKSRIRLVSQDWIAIILTLSIFTAIFMMTKESHSLWKLIEKQSPVDFPWRFLAVTTFCGSILGGYLVSQKSNLRYIIIIFFIASLLYTNRNYMRVNQYTQIPLSLYIASELTTNTDDEYLPKWVDGSQAEKENVKRIEVTQATIQNLHQNSKEISFTYSVDINTKAVLHHMYFPGMEFLADEKHIPIKKSSIGSIEVELPSGNHLAKLRYVPTFVMKLSNWISIISAWLLFVLCMQIFKFRKKSL